MHYAVGVRWGHVYGMIRESLPSVSTPLRVLGFSTVVWMVTDNGLLPLLRLSASPRAYPVKIHAYALAAHVAYGVGAWAAYEALRPVSWALASATWWALRAQRKIQRALPRPLKPAARTLARAAATLALKRPERVAAVLGAT